MKEIVKRISLSFLISAFCGLFVNMMIEIIGRIVTGYEAFSPLSTDFRAMFPSESIAVYVNIILYGVIGAAFSGFTFVYELEKIGYIFQNILYYILTGMVWIPIVCLLWQLYKYPASLYFTIAGFVITDIIMTIVGYRMQKQEVEAINLCLQDKS